MIIGVTGGTGSGKSTVTKILRHLGAKVINTDKVAREVTRKGQKALGEIVEYFGSGILNERGELDRKSLGEIVFGNKEKLEVLNNITHKYIIAKIEKRIHNIESRDKYAVIVIDAPIPVERGFIDVVDVVWSVVADRQIKIKRIMERDALTVEEAEKRINSQLSDEEYVKIADEVLVNNGSLKELEEKTVKLFLKYTRNERNV